MRTVDEKWCSVEKLAAVEKRLLVTTRKSAFQLLIQKDNGAKVSQVINSVQDVEDLQKCAIKKPKRNPKINVQQITQAGSIKIPMKRAMEPKPNSVTITLEELKAISGDQNALLDLLKGMLSGSQNNKQLIQESSDNPTTNDDACQEKDEWSRSLPWGVILAVNSTISIKNSKNSVVEGLTFLHNNIGSVLTNLGDLEVLIADLKPSVIALTET